ncbi:MAG TPA: B12-binding domain-containing protein [Phycisphaerae bacterium]|nr:B12-binding domain-containing protein [Phycisphaerae bacterium]
MPDPELLTRFMDPLLSGDRVACRKMLRRQLEQVSDTESLYYGLLWPAMEEVDRLYRASRINIAAEHMATRINRALADQLQTALVPQPPNGKRILIACADGEPEELGGQMCADLFEAGGWDAYFIGGGVPNDEILSLVGQLRPDILLIFGTQPQGVPGVRGLIDLIHEVNSNPTMNIMTSGGVFNRADGLWREVNADLFARTASEALEMAADAQPRRPQPRAVGAPKKRRRRRKPPLLAVAETKA